MFPIMLNNLLASMSFPAAFRIVAYTCTGLLLIANLIMTTRPEYQTQRTVPRVRPNPLGYFKEKVYLFAVVGAFFIAL